MPHDPAEFIGEVLGQPAKSGFDPSSMGYECPFIKSRCIKRSTKLGDEPFPICSVRRKESGKPIQVCVCPKRFYAVDFLNDITSRCWSGNLPENPKIAKEVKMTGFGNVDFVIADILNGNEIGQFLSVELQAIDITGSVRKAYEALRSGSAMANRPTYGLNWGNVYKRYITQLIRKGYFHHHWGSKIVAVMQDAVYNYIKNWAEFMRSTDVKSSTINIIFMAYRYEDDPNNIGGPQKLVLSTVEGTSHANLQQAVLYKEAPAREAFCLQIKKSLSRKAAG